MNMLGNLHRIFREVQLLDSYSTLFCWQKFGLVQRREYGQNGVIGLSVFPNELIQLRLHKPPIKSDIGIHTVLILLTTLPQLHILTEYRMAIG